MKTITEFNAFDLQTYVKTLIELTTGGKTPEEIQAAIAEQKKLEGDKLKIFMQALDIAKARPEQLKRIVVFTGAENEKTPPGAEKREEHYYLAEFFPEPSRPGRPERGHGRDDKRGGRGGDKKGGKGGRRPPRGDRPAGAPGEQAARGPRPEGDANRGRRPSRPPRAPRPAPVPMDPSKRPPPIVLGPRKPVVLPKPLPVPMSARVAAVEASVTPSAPAPDATPAETSPESQSSS